MHSELFRLSETKGNFGNEYVFSKSVCCVGARIRSESSFHFLSESASLRLGLVIRDLGDRLSPRVKKLNENPLNEPRKGMQVKEGYKQTRSNELHHLDPNFKTFR